MAPLQKRALYSFIIGVVFTVALIAILVAKGDVTAFDREESLRYMVYAVLIGVPLVYLILVNLTLQKPTQIDERDKLIMDKAGKAQWVAVIFSLAAWIIVLTEVYHDQRQVPLVFLNLMFIFTLIISTLAQSLGILLGYLRMNRNGQD